MRGGLSIFDCAMRLDMLEIQSLSENKINEREREGKYRGKKQVVVVTTFIRMPMFDEEFHFHKPNFINAQKKTNLVLSNYLQEYQLELTLSIWICLPLLSVWRVLFAAVGTYFSSIYSSAVPLYMKKNGNRDILE